MTPQSASGLTLQEGATQRELEPTFPVAGWDQLDGERATIFYREGDSLRAARMSAVFHRIPKLPALREDGLHAQVWIAPTWEAMDTLVGGGVPEWGAALALPNEATIVVPGQSPWPATPIEEVRTLRHEWAHVALAHELPGLRIPRWFTEGYAEWAAGGWAAGGAWKLRIAFALGKAPALDSINLSWPRQRHQAEVAYLLSASVIEYLVHSSGTSGLEALFEAWRREGNFDRALRSVYGATPSQLESDWRKHVKRRYGWLMVVSHSAVFWAILSGVILAAGVFRRRHAVEGMGRLRAGDPPDDPAYWEFSELPEPRPQSKEGYGGKTPGGG